MHGRRTKASMVKYLLLGGLLTIAGIAAVFAYVVTREAVPPACDNTGKTDFPTCLKSRFPSGSSAVEAERFLQERGFVLLRRRPGSVVLRYFGGGITNYVITVEIKTSGGVIQQLSIKPEV